MLGNEIFNVLLESVSLLIRDQRVNVLDRWWAGNCLVYVWWSYHQMQVFVVVPINVSVI